MSRASQFGAHSIPGPDGAQFEEMTFRVIDEETASPLPDVVVQVMCIGDTPYGSRSYVTDAEGVVTVIDKKSIEGEAAFSIVKVAKEGYGEIVRIVVETDPVVPLKRVL
jgi:hypothetical protein